ncbi:unnamed protein product [Toxocara canis]|uniref:Uncharacterized protein n=1 Tax=Toxocara canis TaxID=6265 RepID=A0A183V5R7_TOXCA|nr:unnamed protein product [Toxocara canis]
MGHWFGKLYSITSEEVPQTALVSHERNRYRILTDPRSPTSDIRRTPVVVESTPEREDEVEFAVDGTSVRMTKKSGGLHQRILQKQVLGRTECSSHHLCSIFHSHGKCHKGGCNPDPIAVVTQIKMIEPAVHFAAPPTVNGSVEVVLPRCAALRSTLTTRLLDADDVFEATAWLFCYGVRLQPHASFGGMLRPGLINLVSGRGHQKGMCAFDVTVISGAHIAPSVKALDQPLNGDHCKAGISS